MSPLFVIRPVVLDDLPKLISLLKTLEHSLTSMPQDASILEKRIHRSIQSFYPGISEPGSEQYFFVLEDTSCGKVIGTASVIARVGGYEPFYTYRIHHEHIEHQPLGISKNMPVLHLSAEHDGPSELGSLYLHPDYRRSGIGRLLSLSRLMFMAKFPRRFRSRVIAEFRGWVDEQGRSPFWDHVGRHFFEREFDEADFLSGIGNKEFINDLMPRYPIYIPLLPEAIQQKIGAVHCDTEPAVAILKKEGFSTTNAVDIFDAGPMFEAQLTDLRIHKTLKTLKASEASSSAPLTDVTSCLIANTNLEFRCCLCQLNLMEMKQPSVTLPNDVFAALKINPGDSISVVSLKPELPNT